MSSRDQILARLRQAKRPFPTVSAPEVYQPMVPVDDISLSALQSRFLQAAQKVNCLVHQAPTDQAAVETILHLLGDEKVISAWDPAHIPLSGLGEALQENGIKLLGQDENVRYGLTGVHAALAATGSLLLMSGSGRPRAASLLPPVHIAVVSNSQILPDMESWWAVQKKNGLDQTRRHSNIVLITGPSRTADIAMQTVMGMHGPRELHIVLKES